MFHRKNKRQKKSQEMLDIDLMEEIGYYQKKPQKKGLDQKIRDCAGACGGCGCMRAVFAVVLGEKNGGEGRKPVYEHPSFAKKSVFPRGIICFCSAKAEAERALEKSPYIASAKLSAKLPIP
ncbi:MAG: hypothetical protein V8Q32_04085 [Anaerotignum faecicola]